MAYAGDLKSLDASRAGSSPALGTIRLRDAKNHDVTHVISASDSKKAA